MKDEQEWYGHAELDNTDPIPAGSFITRTLTFTVGKYGMDNGGRIRILFKLASDTGIPQMDDPEGDNYVFAYASNQSATITGTFLKKGGYRPWTQSLELEVGRASLDEGDKIYIVFGDRSQGSKGYKAQTFVEPGYKWKVEAENFETGVFIPLDDVPITPIINNDPYKAVLLAPSFSTKGEAINGNLKIEDAYKNPSPYEGELRYFIQEIDDSGAVIERKQLGEPVTKLGSGVGKTLSFVPEKNAYYQFAVEIKSLHEHWVVSNPIIIQDMPFAKKHYWGDFHAQYDNSTGIGSVEDAFTYARDAAGISFVGHQPNDFLLTEEGWQEAKNAVKKFHVDETFIPILGYEWSGNTPKGGDRNVHYLHDDGPLYRTNHWLVEDKSDIDMDRYDLDALYTSLEKRDDVLVVPHVGGRRCDITKYYHPDLEPVVEICSTHGRFQWLLEEALDNDYTVGVVGGSDDHTGRPGLSYPTNEHFGTRGGLAGVYMEKLNRFSIFEAVKARHTYATTGERIALQVTADNRYMMGDYWEATEAPVIDVKTAGTDSLERIEIYRNKTLAYSHPMYQTQPLLHKIKLEWGGARVKGRRRHSDWDGTLQVENGSIIEAETYAFDHPEQGITEQDEHYIRWHSATSGDHDGIILTLDGDEQTRIHFQTPHGSEQVTLEDIYNTSVYKDCGMVGQYYLIQSHYEEATPIVSTFSWQDPEPEIGRNAYWIKVVQADGEIAWSSPLYFVRKRN